MEYKFIYIKDFLKNRKEENNALFIAKINKSIIIGPYTSDDFDFDDFYNKIISDTSHDVKIYKKISKRKVIKILEDSDIKCEDLKNKMLEHYNTGNIVVHKFINVNKGMDNASS